MSVWVVMPSKRSPEETGPIFKKWGKQGYKIYVQRDEVDFENDTKSAMDYDRGVYRPYAGYAEACNTLIGLALREDTQCDWVVVAADDIEPDAAHSTEEIARDCSEHFGTHRDVSDEGSWGCLTTWGTFGVMQPTGHRWGDAQGAYIDRVAGSPWIGREFAKRMYGGKGPYWPEYTHMGVDEELQAVAVKMGVFWQRPDLIHFHKHWGLPQSDEKMGQRSRMPKFLEKANSPEEWERYKKIFAERRAAGFPGHEPI